MSQLQAVAARPTATEDNKVVGRVVVKPRRMTKLVVGMYETGIPQPKFHLEFESSSHDVDASLFKFDDSDHYTLVYRFQNYGDRACQVTVKEV